LSAKCLINNNQSYANKCKDKLVIDRNVTRKQCKLFSKDRMYFTHKTKLIPYKLCPYTQN